jgi:nucleoside-diphosphate-sugar epimerase
VKTTSVSSRALVTGANGFIGRHLVNALRFEGFVVRAAVRSAESLTRFDKDVETVTIGDIGPNTDWSRAIDGVDIVYHLAAIAHRIDAVQQQNEGAYRVVNSLGSRALAVQCAESHSIRRLIFVSSIAASVSQGPSATSTLPYTTSKREAEQSIREVLSGGLPDWTVVRPPLVYGPGNPGNMERLLHLLRLPLPLPLGGVANRRSFLFVGNLVDLLVRVANNERASRQTFDVADDEVVSTPELIRLIGQVSQCRTRMFAVPDITLRALGRCGDILAAVTRRSVGFDTYSVDRLMGSLTVDSSRAREMLEWQPPFTLRDGLKATLFSRADTQRMTER